MDAHRLKIARNLGGVTSDISSRPQVFVSDNPKKEKGGLFGLLRHKKPE